jgi:methionine-gamma-lyase
MKPRNPVETLANAPHEFGEHGGVNMSVEASTTFTVLHSRTMPEIFRGQKGPEQGGCYLYGRHFNPTVYTLGKQLAALEGTEAAYCTASPVACPPFHPRFCSCVMRRTTSCPRIQFTAAHTH